MTVSSRTPEGVPQRCLVCGGEAAVEPSYPGGDSCCPRCGQLLWEFRDRVGRARGIDPMSIQLTTSLSAELAKDSIDLVELVMELEEEFDIRIADEDAVRVLTVEDVLRHLLNVRQDS